MEDTKILGRLCREHRYGVGLDNATGQWALVVKPLGAVMAQGRSVRATRAKSFMLPATKTRS